MAIENLLINSGFESNDSWRLNLGAAIVNNNAYEGSRCLAFLSKGTSATQYCHQSVRVVRGKSYVLSFYAKHTGNMRVWMSAGYMISATEQRHFYDVNLILTNIYKKFTLQFTMPSNAYSDIVEIGIMGGYGPNTGDAAWVDKAELVGESPLPEPTMCFADVECNTSGLKIRSARVNNESNVLGYWPKGRLAVVETIPGDDQWMRCKWKNSDAFVNKSFLRNIRPIPSQLERHELLASIANNELTVIHALKFYGPNLSNPNNVNWCHYFADWFAGHWCWNAVTIPDESNCRDGVIRFLQYGSFIFVNQWHKQEVKRHAPQTSQYMDEENLDSFETNYRPRLGDYVYFRKTPTETEYAQTETSYHVGIVTDVTSYGSGYKVTAIEGNVTQNYASDSVQYVTYIPDPEHPNNTGGRFHHKILGFAPPGGLG